jgi:cardiolipin synthase
MDIKQYVLLSLIFLLQLTFSIRVLLRTHRQPASRIAWLVVINAFPLVGVLAYLALGEVSIGLSRMQRLKVVQQYLELTQINNIPEQPPEIPPRYQALFTLGQSISGFFPVSGNTAQLLATSETAIEQLVADIDVAQRHISILFYIWLDDNSGKKVADALVRAAQRGLTCRVLIDRFGSRLLLRSPLWRAMREAGVKLGIALPVKSLLFAPLTGRLDIRNHRKIAVIDHNITYCGSQNCADPAFKVKAKYAPWVDIWVRFTGPIARQNQILFANDWLLHVKEDTNQKLHLPLIAGSDANVIAQVIGTGPTTRATATSEFISQLLSAAHERIVISTPYYVPDEIIQTALCTAAYRGVDISIIFPARNDSWIVSAASRSYYISLLQAGVKIYEYQKGLLHAKTITLDNELSFIGSTNLDRRSFELNYENNMLIYNQAFTHDLQTRQNAYLADSQQITLEAVQAWSKPKQLWNNTIAMLGPVL